MAESNELCITAAKPDGHGELTSAKSCAAENTQSARMRGFPFEGLQSTMQSALDKGIPQREFFHREDYHKPGVGYRL